MPSLTVGRLETAATPAKSHRDATRLPYWLRPGRVDKNWPKAQYGFDDAEDRFDGAFA